LFYPAGIKLVPSDIYDLLTPLGLAYWICDDGTISQDGAVVLYTNSFSVDEVNLLVSVLTNKFNLNCTLNLNQGKYIIRISGKSLSDLQNLLKNIMPPMMLHKIGL
jgi:hydroxymethylpyrimidine pyrophosphatase-like HAD family hydrolase